VPRQIRGQIAVKKTSDRCLALLISVHGSPLYPWCPLQQSRATRHLHRPPQRSWRLRSGPTASSPSRSTATLQGTAWKEPLLLPLLDLDRAALGGRRGGGRDVPADGDRAAPALQNPQPGAGMPLAGIHRAQAGLASGMAPPDVPASVRDEAERLRAELEAVNSKHESWSSRKISIRPPHRGSLPSGWQTISNRLLADVDLYELWIANALWPKRRTRSAGVIWTPCSRSTARCSVPSTSRTIRAARDSRSTTGRAADQQPDQGGDPPGALDTYTRLVITTPSTSRAPGSSLFRTNKRETLRSSAAEP